MNSCNCNQLYRRVQTTTCFYLLLYHFNLLKTISRAFLMNGHDFRIIISKEEKKVSADIVFPAKLVIRSWNSIHFIRSRFKFLVKADYKNCQTELYYFVNDLKSGTFRISQIYIFLRSTPCPNRLIFFCLCAQFFV